MPKEVEDPEAPAAPADLSASAVAEERIDIAWQAPFDGGSAITGYRIQRKGPGESSYSDLQENTGDTTTSYSDQGLALESAYSYRVAANNAVGESGFSDEVTATTGDPIEPGMPVDVTLEMNGEELSIQWTSVEGFLYQVQVSSDLQTWTNHGEAIIGDGTQINVTDLPGEETAATFFRVTVQASEGSGSLVL